MNRRAKQLTQKLYHVGEDYFDVLPIVRLAAFGILFGKFLKIIRFIRGTVLHSADGKWISSNNKPSERPLGVSFTLCEDSSKLPFWLFGMLSFDLTTIVFKTRSILKQFYAYILRVSKH